MAGLVGIGLSRLFSVSGLEVEEVGRDHRLANSMGLFLQKTNIIRDYLEDVLQGREFWPKAVSALLHSIAILSLQKHILVMCALLCSLGKPLITNGGISLYSKK